MANRAIQGMVQAWMAGQKDGKSRKIPERFQGSVEKGSQIRDQG